jgi:hypothetical protein
MEAPSLETMDITHRMIQEKIRSLRPASAPGPDGIGPGHLKSRWETKGFRAVSERWSLRAI